MLRLAVGLIFIALPMLELALLIKIGQGIGVWATLALVVGTGVDGCPDHVAAELHGRCAGRRRRWRRAGRRSRRCSTGCSCWWPAPADHARALTDAVALLLLVPPVRRVIARWSVQRLLRTATVRVHEHRR